MSEHFPRYDQARREADGSVPHDMCAPALLRIMRGGETFDTPCETAAEAMQLATATLHRHAGVPDRIVLADGAEIGTVAIRQEYERKLALGGFEGR